MVKKSIFASLLIALGSMVLIAAPAPLGTILFAFGLLGICALNGNLYTGKCGYIFENNDWKSLAIILITNILSGWIFGFILSYINPTAIDLATAKMILWENNYLVHFIQACFCGTVMFLAVDIRKKTNSNLGIIYGIPLFIFCGFQHSIANAITLGMAHNVSVALLFAIIGNFLGATATWWLNK